MENNERIVFECKGTSDSKKMEKSIAKGVEQKNSLTDDYYRKLVIGTHINTDNKDDPNYIYIEDPDFPDYNHIGQWDINMYHMIKAFEFSKYSNTIIFLKEIIELKHEIIKKQERTLSARIDDLIEKFEKLQTVLYSTFQEEIKKLDKIILEDNEYAGHFYYDERSKKKIFFGLNSKISASIVELNPIFDIDEESLKKIRSKNTSIFSDGTVLKVFD